MQDTGEYWNTGILEWQNTGIRGVNSSILPEEPKWVDQSVLVHIPRNSQQSTDVYLGKGLETLKTDMNEMRRAI